MVAYSERVDVGDGGWCGFCLKHFFPCASSDSIHSFLAQASAHVRLDAFFVCVVCVCIDIYVCIYVYVVYNVENTHAFYLADDGFDVVVVFVVYVCCITLWFWSARVCGGFVFCW